MKQPRHIRENSMVGRESSLELELAALLSRHSEEGASNAPDFVLAGFLMATLAAWNDATRDREAWHAGQRYNDAEHARQARMTAVALAHAMKQAAERLRAGASRTEVVALVEKALGRQEPPPPIRETVEDSAEVLRALEDR